LNVTGGNVGIGTNAPGTTLHLSTSDPRITITDTDSGGDFVIRNSNGAAYLSTLGAHPMLFITNSLERLRISTSGNVGIGTNTPAYKLEVNGSFAATTKSFVIDHPTKEGMKLRHGSLEGPENGVYVRGKTDGFVIDLPDYWTGLVDEDSITVSLTAIGKAQTLWVKDIKDNKVFVGSKCSAVKYFYTIFGERKDVEKLEVEF